MLQHRQEAKPARMGERLHRVDQRGQRAAPRTPAAGPRPAYYLSHALTSSGLGMRPDSLMTPSMATAGVASTPAAAIDG